MKNVKKAADNRKKLRLGELFLIIFLTFFAIQNDK